MIFEIWKKCYTIKNSQFIVIIFFKRQNSSVETYQYLKLSFHKNDSLLAADTYYKD